MRPEARGARLDSCEAANPWTDVYSEEGSIQRYHATLEIDDFHHDGHQLIGAAWFGGLPLTSAYGFVCELCC